MSLFDKLFMPRRLMIAGLVAIAGLLIAIAVQLLTPFHTQPYVRTLLVYLMLDYMWATVKRELFPSTAPTNRKNVPNALAFARRARDRFFGRKR